MGTYGSGSAIRYTSNLVVGGFLCLGIILLIIASTIVLSLISLYIPNHGDVGYGEHYQIKAFLIKALYQDRSFVFYNGTVADSTSLSALCGSIYRNQGQNNVAGCVAKDFRAFGPRNISLNSRRRRRVINAGLYEIGEINLYYSTSCPHKSDILQYANSTSLSNCVRRRLTACNNLVNGPSQSSNWTRLSGHFLQMIISINESDYQTVTVEALFGLSISSASSVAPSLELPPAIANDIQLGCQYLGPLPQEKIAEALNFQTIATTPQPSTSSSPDG